MRLDLKRRGLGRCPQLVTGDGALGFRKALRHVPGAAREQRCWIHKTANVSNRLPKGLRNKAKQHLQDDEPHRERLRQGSPPHAPDQGTRVPQDGAGHGLQAVPERAKEMEKTRWIKSTRRDHSRRQIHERRTPGPRRRLTTAYTTFDNSSVRGKGEPHRGDRGQGDWRHRARPLSPGRAGSSCPKEDHCNG